MDKHQELHLIMEMLNEEEIVDLWEELNYDITLRLSKVFKFKSDNSLQIIFDFCKCKNGIYDNLLMYQNLSCDFIKSNLPKLNKQLLMINPNLNKEIISEIFDRYSDLM
jgi:hypothetical protein